MKPSSYFKKESAFAALITACFTAGGIIMLLHHEMWRDELEPWLIGRYSSSMIDLVKNMRYEGHPPLWYMLLYGITRISTNPIAMQIVNLLIAATAIYLFVRFAPLPRKWKGLFAFGFYPFYQYSIVCRGYALCTLLLFAYCALYKDRQRRFPYLIAVLFLMASADVYSWFFCIALTTALVAAWWSDIHSSNKWRTGTAGIIAGLLIIGIGLAISVLWCRPPKDGGWFTAWYLHPSLERLILAIYGFVIDINFGPRMVYLVFSLVSLAIVTLTFIRKRMAAVAWLVLCASLFVFYYVKFLPFYWQKGMVLEFVAGCAWLACYEDEKPFNSKWLDNLTQQAGRLFAPMVVIVLSFFVLYGLKWIVGDLRGPYSAAKPVAEYIKCNRLQNLAIVGDPDFSAQGVSAFLGKRIYYPASDSYGRYVIWNNRRHWPLEKGELISDVSSFAKSQKNDFLLLVGYELTPDQSRRLDAKLLLAYPRTVKSEEEMWLYKLPPKL